MEAEIWINSDDLGFDIHLQQGRRRMQWGFASGDQDVEDLKETLLQILEELGHDPIRVWKDETQKAWIAKGAPALIDPRENPVAGVMATKEYQQAVNGSAWFGGDEDVDLPTSGIIDYDNPQARAGADQAARGRGVDSNGKGAEGVNYDQRFAPKDSDKRR